jgi:hypothetical protein
MPMANYLADVQHVQAIKEYERRNGKPPSETEKEEKQAK